jgi:hypothetical protein
MRSKKLTKKLVLNKSTVTNLDTRTLGVVNGGKSPTYTAAITCGIFCDTVYFSCAVTQCHTDFHSCPVTWCDTECGC